MPDGPDPPEGAPGLRRICIVLSANTLLAHGGSPAYLTHFAAALKRAGKHVTLLSPRPFAPPRGWLRMKAEYLAPYDEIHLRGMRTHGSLGVSVSPRVWRRHLLDRGWRPRNQQLFAPLSPPEIDWTLRRIARLRPGIVVMNYAANDALLSRLPPGVVGAILAHDVFALKQRSAAAAGLRDKLGGEEALVDMENAAFRAAHVNLAIKDEEAAHIREVAPGSAVMTFPVIVPAGRADLAAPRGPVASFVGTGNVANRDAVAWIAGEIWPLVRARLPMAELRVAGRIAEAMGDGFFEAHAQHGIVAVGFVDDLAQELGRAAVTLAPLRAGSGVKIKIVESMAEGLPCVTTATGAEGLLPAPADVIRIGEDAESLAAATVAALSSPRAAQEREAARAFIEARFGLGTAALEKAAELDRLAARFRAS